MIKDSHVLASLKKLDEVSLNMYLNYCLAISAFLKFLTLLSIPITVVSATTILGFTSWAILVILIGGIVVAPMFLVISLFDDLITMALMALKQ